MENNNPHIAPTDSTIIHYVEEKLSNTEQQQLEAAMQTDAFLNDAIEGLQQLEHTQNINATLQQLHTNLQQQVQQTKRKKRKQHWLQVNAITAALAVAIVLLLCYCVYYFVWLKK